MRNSRHLPAALGALLLSLCAASALAASPLPASPPLSGIYDGAALLSQEELVRVGNLRAALEVKSQAKLYVVTLADAGGETPKALAMAALNQWHAGQRSAVLLVLLNPRKLYLQPGDALANTFDEATASSLCADTVAPKLRAGQKAEALIAGLEGIAARIPPFEAKEARPFTPEKENPTPQELQRKMNDFAQETPAVAHPSRQAPPPVVKRSLWDGVCNLILNKPGVVGVMLFFLVCTCAFVFAIMKVVFEAGWAFLAFVGLVSPRSPPRRPALSNATATDPSPSFFSSDSSDSSDASSYASSESSSYASSDSSSYSSSDSSSSYSSSDSGSSSDSSSGSGGGGSDW